MNGRVFRALSLTKHKKRAKNVCATKKERRIGSDANRDSDNNNINCINHIAVNINITDSNDNKEATPSSERCVGDKQQGDAYHIDDDVAVAAAHRDEWCTRDAEFVAARALAAALSQRGRPVASQSGGAFAIGPILSADAPTAALHRARRGDDNDDATFNRDLNFVAANDSFRGGGIDRSCNAADHSRDSLVAAVAKRECQQQQQQSASSLATELARRRRNAPDDSRCVAGAFVTGAYFTGAYVGTRVVRRRDDCDTDDDSNEKVGNDDDGGGGDDNNDDDDGGGDDDDDDDNGDNDSVGFDIDDNGHARPACD